MIENHSFRLPTTAPTPVLAGDPGQLEDLHERSGNDGAPMDASIMIIDDEPINCKVVRRFLTLEGYSRFTVITEPLEAVARIQQEQPDIVLLDLMMPEVSGLDILERIAEYRKTTFLPVLILTAVSDQETRKTALRMGATDFLVKPVDPNELLPRVRNLLVIRSHHMQIARHAEQLEQQVRERTAELARTRLEVVHCLGRAAEFRDNDTGNHVVRVGRYAGVIARAMGLDAETVELIEHAAPLHDVGKIGISDSVLLKPGKLDPDEIEMMQKHCGIGKTILGSAMTERDTWRSHVTIGAKIFGEPVFPLLKLAATIALTHHEKWDGTGYPLGLAGDDIPLPGRIVAVADVFDALTSKRPYKPPFPLDKAFAIMEAERGKHFDPQVLDAFCAKRDEIIQVQLEYADLALAA